ncbi:MAG: HAD family hydrolase [Acutalibacter sp.]|jgi:phosphoglycolate phosphatase|nr:HAD family hydrolase [Acutalibacter sp.]
MKKALLFDLDGTLTDPGEGITKSVQYALEKMGCPEPDRDKLRAFIGPPLLEQFMAYRGFTQEEAAQAVAYYRERFAPIGIFENKIYPGIPELLADLQEQGFRLAVASSKPEKFVVQILEHFGLSSYFEETVGATMDQRRTAKADVIEEALGRLRLAGRKQALMIGDREHDVFGARAMGLDCVGVSYGYGSTAELEATGAAAIAASPEELGVLLPVLAG